MGVPEEAPEVLCSSWIWIDGGNDTARCRLRVGHLGNHQAHGVGEWTNAEHDRAVKALDDD